MGYRSDVTITLYKQDFETLVRQASENANGALDLIKYASLYKNEASDIVTLFWKSIKFYDGYNDVDFVTRYIQGISYSMKIIGEETTDITEEYHNDSFGNLGDATYIERYIDINMDLDGDEQQTSKEYIDKKMNGIK